MVRPRPLLALLLIPSFFATTGVVLVAHSHDLNGHVHSEHHHGLSIHEHDLPLDHRDDGAAHVDDCGAEQHIATVPFVCTAASAAAVSHLAVLVAAPPVEELAAGVPANLEDVRVHGPPPGIPQSPRAPPLITRL